MKDWKILLVALLWVGCKPHDKAPLSGNTIPSSADMLKAEAFFNTNDRKDSAFYYFTNVTELEKDSLLVAMAYSYMAMIQNDAGDYFGGQESALEGLKHLGEKNALHHYCLASLYNELGVSSSELKQYEAAAGYYDLAIKFQQDEAFRKVFRNNMAVNYRRMGNYLQAIQLLRSLTDERDPPLAYARALTNLASARWLADPVFDPMPEFLKALRIRQKEGYIIGIASSYNHISDYYFKLRPDSALYYAKQMFTLAKQVNSSEQKLDALKKLVALAPERESKGYFQQYRHLNDSIVTARNQAKNQFALIKYQAEKNRAENLLLQKENSQKALQILQQKIWIMGILVVVALLSGWGIWQFRRKKQQLEWKAKERIRENHLRTSQKVHDIVANGLYRIMSEMEHHEEVDKETWLDRIELLYERSRDISYEPLLEEQHHRDWVNDVVMPFANDQTNISLVGNEADIWKQVPEAVLHELELVLEELMVNMSKHSHAHHVVLRFELNKGLLTLQYRDDGVGFPEEVHYGNGLRSTETRIHRIGGRLILASQSNQGASIKIEIPISTP